MYSNTPPIGKIDTLIQSQVKIQPRNLFDSSLKYHHLNQSTNYKKQPRKYNVDDALDQLVFRVKQLKENVQFLQQKTDQLPTIGEISNNRIYHNSSIVLNRPGSSLSIEESETMLMDFGQLTQILSGQISSEGEHCFSIMSFGDTNVNIEDGQPSLKQVIENF